MVEMLNPPKGQDRHNAGHAKKLIIPALGAELSMPPKIMSKVDSVFMRKMMATGSFDFHIHTTQSDGKLSPSEIVWKAAKEGVASLSITDHDTVTGLPEARSEGAKYSINIINGVELTAYCGGLDIHVLGYMFNDSNSDLAHALDYLHSKKGERLSIILEKLRKVGVELVDQEIAPNLARRMVATINILYALVRKGYARDLESGYWQYLAPGKEAYHPRPVFSLETASGLIREAGGIAVLAHPGLIRIMQHDPEIKNDASFASLDHWKMTERIAASGLVDGIEIWHPYHKDEDVRKASGICTRYGLISTGGSDFHQEPRALMKGGNGIRPGIFLDN